MLCNSVRLDGYKPLRHDPIQEDFDQQTQYAYELDPMETADEIVIGVGIGVLQVDDPEEGMI
mgnify:CR=1 FL=1